MTTHFRSRFHRHWLATLPLAALGMAASQAPAQEAAPVAPSKVTPPLRQLKQIPAAAPPQAPTSAARRGSGRLRGISVPIERVEAGSEAQGGGEPLLQQAADAAQFLE